MHVSHSYNIQISLLYVALEQYKKSVGKFLKCTLTGIAQKQTFAAKYLQTHNFFTFLLYNDGSVAWAFLGGNRSCAEWLLKLHPFLLQLW